MKQSKGEPTAAIKRAAIHHSARSGLHSTGVLTPVPYHAGSGEPLVLLHGFTDTWRGWTPILAALSAHHEVYAWSLAGHVGGDPWDRSVPLTITTSVDVVERQLDALGLDRVHVVGNSLGGWLALELAVRGRALSVVGVCPAGGWEPGSREERTAAGVFRRNQLLLRFFGPLLPFVARFAVLRRIALRDMVADGRKVPPASAVAMFEGARGCAIIDDVLGLVGTGETFGDLGSIDCPVRIMYGSQDRLLRWPNYYARMRRLLPDADWVRLNGLGHLAMWDSPETVAGAILEHTSRALGRAEQRPPIEPTGAA
jgi:pimeloyl-ACP methyl ester carboxylesterase